MAAPAEEGLSTEWVMVSDLAQCMLCFGTLKKPRILTTCGHAFCFDCLWQWWEESADSDMTSVLCPTCRISCALPTEGIGALPTDVKGSRRGELLKQCIVVVSKQSPPGSACSASAANTGPATSPPPCDICSMEAEEAAGAAAAPAVKYCEDCQNHLCQSCSAKHSNTAIFARHKVSSLGDTGNAPTEVLCSRHPGKPLRYYCASCPSISCSVCVTTQHSDAGHDVGEIDDLIERKRAHLAGLAAEVQRMSRGLDDRDALTEDTVMRTKDAFWEVGRRISQHAERCRKEVDDAENRLLAELEEKKNLAVQRTRDKGNKRHYTITDLEGIQAYSTRLLETSAPLEFIVNCSELEERMQTVLKFRQTQANTMDKTIGVTFIVQQGLLSLGRLEEIVESKAVCGSSSSGAQGQRKIMVIKASENKDRAKLPHMQEASNRRSPRQEKQDDEKTAETQVQAGAAPSQDSQERDSRQRKEDQTKTMKGQAPCIILEVPEMDLVPHLGEVSRHRRSHRRSSSRHERRSASLHDYARRRSGSATSDWEHPLDERGPRASGLSALARCSREVMALREEEPSARLLWEAKTMELEKGETSQPRDVGFLQNGDVFVLNDQSHNLVRLSEDGKQRRVIGSDLTSPMCVVVTPDGQPAVTDSQEKSITLFSPDGASYSVWSLENIMASGAVMAPSGQWYVLDKVDDVLGVFPETGARCERLVTLGKHLLYTERYIATDSRGRIFVSGSEDTAVAVFDKDGHHIMDVGGAGSKGGYVSVPRGLFVDERDNLIVADRHNHRVSMFSPEGRFVRHLVSCPFDRVIWPTGIDFNKGQQEQTRMALTVSDAVVQVYDVTDVI